MKNPTYYETIVKSDIWQEWTKHAEDNLLFDMPESIECGWLSDRHWSAFIEWVKNKAVAEYQTGDEQRHLASTLDVIVQKCNCEMKVIENLSDNICPECEREIPNEPTR